MGSGVFTHFEPAPDGRIRFRTRFEDDTGRVGHADNTVEPQPEVLGIPWQQLIDAGYGALEYHEDGTASIRRVDNQSEEAETGS